MTASLPYSNSARDARHDALAKSEDGGFRGFSRHWTRRAIRVLRTAAKNPFIKQARNSYGSLNASGHGTVCANQVLIELLDNLRNEGGEQQLNKLLPISTTKIISLNDKHRFSFEQIADVIEQAAGGPEALADA